VPTKMHKNYAERVRGLIKKLFGLHFGARQVLKIHIFVNKNVSINNIFDIINELEI
jgi:hypothetical protein